MADEELIFQNCLWYLKLVSAWSDTDNNLRFYALFALRLITYVPLWCGTLLHLIAVTKEENNVGLYRDLTIILAATAVQYMMFRFVRKIRPLSILFKKISNFDQFGRPAEADEINRLLHLCSKTAFYFASFFNVGYGLYAMFLSNCKRDEEVVGTVCGVMFPTLFPFNTNVFPAWQIVALVQIYAISFMYIGASAVLVAYLTICVHLKLRFRHLKRLLKEVFDTEGYEDRRRKLHFCIRYHDDILGLCALCDKCFTGAMGTGVVFIACIFGCMALEFMNEYSFYTVGHIFGWMAHFFLSCYLANEVMLESMSVTQAAYDSKWYEGEVDLRKDLLLVMMRGHKPFVLHAFPLASITLDYFVGAIKTAYSILTLLKNYY